MVNRYYHYICNDYEKEIYFVLLDGLMNYQNKIYFQKSLHTTPILIEKVFKMVLYDNPQIFYSNIQGSQIGDYFHSLVLIPKYNFPLESVNELIKWLNERVEEICRPIVGIDDVFSKEIYIHNYLAKNVNYGTSEVAQTNNAYTVIGTLLENNSVCAGVALSFKLLMDYLSIPCIVATGTATNSAGITERHAWNLVHIDDSYYQVDVTWDLLDGQKDRVIKYDYFNLTTKEMYRSRIPDFEYPICVNQLYNYFEYMNALVDSPYQLKEFITNQAYKGEKRIYVKYTFDTREVKRNISKYLRTITILGKYRYWINEDMSTLLIERL